MDSKGVEHAATTRFGYVIDPFGIFLNNRDSVVPADSSGEVDAGFEKPDEI